MIAAHFSSNEKYPEKNQKKNKQKWSDVKMGRISLLRGERDRNCEKMTTRSGSLQRVACRRGGVTGRIWKAEMLNSGKTKQTETKVASREGSATLWKGDGWVQV